MVELKIAELAEIPEIAVLEKELFSDAWSEEMLTDCLTKPHYRVMACVNVPDAEPKDEAEERRAIDVGEAAEPGAVVGYLISTHVAGEAELLRIGVDPSARRKGVGRLLMMVFVGLCEELGTLEAFLEVRASNLSAITLYDQFGFSVAGIRKNYYHHPDEDACLMTAVMRDPRVGVPD